jgi:hypothetical protein
MRKRSLEWDDDVKRERRSMGAAGKGAWRFGQSYFKGVARMPGERTLVACWFSHSAKTNFVSVRKPSPWRCSPRAHRRLQRLWHILMSLL